MSSIFPMYLKPNAQSQEYPTSYSYKVAWKRPPFFPNTFRSEQQSNRENYNP
jgi:hypothetical protein